jgi:ankyrin repeat protein
MTSTSLTNKNLAAAIDRGSLQCVRSQLRTGADPNAIFDIDGIKMHVLAYAIRRRAGLYLYRALLDGGAAVSPTNEGNILFPIYSAAIEGDLVTCRELVQRGAVVDQKTEIGATALQVAAYGGHFAVGKFLVESGADVRHENNRGMTALDMAVTSMFPRTALQLAKLFVAHGASSSRITALPGQDRVSAFHRAISLGAVDFVAYFLDECGEDPNQRTPDGRTMLELANSDTVKEVLGRSMRMARVEETIGDSIGAHQLTHSTISSDARGPGPL